MASCCSLLTSLPAVFKVHLLILAGTRARGLRTSRAWCQKHHCSSLPIIPWTGHVCLQVQYDVFSCKIVEESSHVSELQPWQHFSRAEEVVALARLANCLLASRFLSSAAPPKRKYLDKWQNKRLYIKGGQQPVGSPPILVPPHCYQYLPAAPPQAAPQAPSDRHHHFPPQPYQLARCHRHQA